MAKTDSVELELLLLAIASAFWPLLLAVVIIALRAPHPPRLLISFLAGGLLTTVVVGLLVIHLLRDTTLLTRSKSTTDPVVYIAAGAIAFGLGFLLLRRTRATQPDPVPESAEKAPGRLDRMLSKGVPLAFLAGVVVNIIPGVFPLVALKDIAGEDYSDALTVLIVICFYLIMFALIEVPLIAYAVAPERTASETARFNTWLDHNSRRVAAYALCVVGAYLLVRGVTSALTA